MIKAMRGNITYPHVRRLATGNQIVRRRDKPGYRLVDKFLLNAGSTHRGRPPTLSIRVRKICSTNVAHTPPATKSP
jgi:hypothetical protein